MAVAVVVANRIRRYILVQYEKYRGSLDGGELSLATADRRQPVVAQ